jgi:DNA-directed RNA polymerase specialized sigma24 family protein
LNVTQHAICQPQFEDVRGRLFGIAYRLPGSRAEAEHVVQDAAHRRVGRLAPFAVTIVNTRVQNASWPLQPQLAAASAT